MFGYTRLAEFGLALKGLDLTIKDRFKLTTLSCRKRKWALLLILLGGLSYLFGSQIDDLPMPVDKWGMLGFFAGAVQLWVDMQKNKGVKEVNDHVGSETSKGVSMVLEQFGTRLDRHQIVVSEQHDSLRQTLQLLINGNKNDNERHQQHEGRLEKLEEGQKKIMTDIQKISEKVGAN